MVMFCLKVRALSSKTSVPANGQKKCASSPSVWEVTVQSCPEGASGVSLIVPITVGDKPASAVINAGVKL